MAFTHAHLLISQLGESVKHDSDENVMKTSTSDCSEMHAKMHEDRIFENENAFAWAMTIEKGFFSDL